MKKLLALLLTLFFIPSLAYADGTIDSLSAGSALGGTELIPMFQSANPAVTTTPSAIKTYITAQNLNFTGTFQLSGQTFSLGTLTNGDFCTWTTVGNVLNCNSPGGATGANPTATAGPAAVNGVATTFMRSDAAPAVQKGSSSQFGIMECDGTTITCPGGVATASGGSATAITVGTTTVGSGTSPQFLYDNSGVLGVRTFNSSDLPPFTQQEVTTSCSVLTTSGGCSGSTNGDMGNGVVLGGSGATLTLSAKATGLWQPGQTFQISVDPAATGNWTLTNSTTLTLRGMNNSTTLYPGESGTFVADSNGTNLDFVPGTQPPASGALGGVNSIAATTHEWINAIGTTGLPTQTQPACGDLSNGGTACQANTGTSGGNVPLLNTANAWSGAQRGVPVNVAISTATFTPNFNTAQNFEIDLTSACPCTLANPSTTLVAGQSGMIEIHQDGTGSRTIGTWGADYQYAGGTATITLSTTANAVDYLSYYVNNAATGIVLGTILKNPAH